jgi:diguanylate cyclase (GGDEF)-like protein
MDIKIAHKLVYVPNIIIVVIFAIGILVIEQTASSALETAKQSEMLTLSKIVPSVLSQQKSASDLPLFKNISAAVEQFSDYKGAQVSLFTKDGLLISDFLFSPEQRTTLPAQLEPPELALVLKNKTAMLTKYNDELQQNMRYFARYDAPSQMIIRVALPDATLQQQMLTVNTSVIWLFTIAILFALGISLISYKLLTIVLIKANSQQNQRIAEHTREIALLQTMITMLNTTQDVQEAGRIIRTILLKLLPEHSGALFITDHQQQNLQQLSHWGAHWSEEITVIVSHCPEQEGDTKCQSCAQSKQFHCIKLNHNGVFLGFLQFYQARNEISEQFKQITARIAEAISNALASLQLKNVLHEQAIRDPLTNLYNRRFMYEVFEQTLHRAERHQQHVAVLMVDIDYFKQLNDNFGHDAGDQVLMSIAGVFQHNVRLEDISCRYGGEEFCFICPDSTLADAYNLAEKLRLQIAALQVYYQGELLPEITISIGVALFPMHGNECKTLIIEADRALYLAKEQGRNRTVVANSPPQCQTR